MGKVAIIDLDGVVADFVGGFSRWAGEDYPRAGIWDFFTEWGWNKERWGIALEEFVEESGFYRHVLPIEGRETLRASIGRLLNHGFTLVFATHRPREAYQQTALWIRQFIDPEVTFGLHILDGSKADALENYFGDDLYVIDDSPIEVANWAAKEGFKGHLAHVRRPWNVGCDGEPFNSFSEWVHYLCGDDQIVEVPSQARTRTLETAHGLVNGDRNNQYGSPTQDFARTAGIWTALFGGKVDSATGGTVPFAAHDVALALAAVKLSRLTWSPLKGDSWVDLAGYAACGAEAAEVLGNVVWPEQPVLGQDVEDE